MALLDEYLVGTDGPWSDREAAHLYRRAGFGATPEERAEAIGDGTQTAFRAAIDALVNVSALDPHLDQPGGTGSGSYGDPLADLPDDDSDLGKVKSPDNLVPLIGRWLYRMRYTSQPLQEQLTLFYHDHFVSEFSKIAPVIFGAIVGSGCYPDATDEEIDQLVFGKTVEGMLTQNDLYRHIGFDNFRDMLLAVTRDPAMLVYLDNIGNRKGRAQENYAREMMELFSMGVGNYSEQDIREIAKCLTGETVPSFDCASDFDGSYGFLPSIHETGTKLVFGETIPFSNTGSETEQVIDLLMDKVSVAPFVETQPAPYNDLPATAVYISWKLLSWFVNNTVSLDPPSPEVLELAHYMRGTDNAAYPQRRFRYDIRACLRKIFLSKYFYQESQFFAMYKNPADFVVGALRALGIQDQFTSDNGPGVQMVTMGMILFIPPNVSGWQHGPAWVTSGSMISRYNYADYLTEFQAFLNPQWAGEIQNLLAANGGPIIDENDFGGLVDYFTDRLIQDDLTEEERSLLINFLAGMPSNNALTRFRDRVLGLIHVMLTLPKAHLK